MTRILLLVALLLATPAMAVDIYRAASNDVADQYYSVRIDVDATGRVTQAELEGDVPQALRPSVHRVAAASSFEPATVSGTPVASRTSVNVRVRFTREGSRYRADILEVLPGGGWQMRSNPPSYPKRPLRDGVGAYVLAYVQYDETGRVDMSKSRIERVIAGSSAGEVQGDALERVNASFSQSVESAMARWRYTPDEVDGKPVAAAVLVPTVFCVDEAWKDCRAVLSAQGQAEASLAAPLDSQVRVAQMKPAPSDEG